MPYTGRVNVVLDRTYGKKLARLLTSGPMWVVDSEQNRTAAESLWKENQEATHSDGITFFSSTNATNTSDMFLWQLDSIDLHHGEYSADPPYSVLYVVGAECSEQIRRELSDFGFNELKDTDEGFEARKTNEI